MSGIKYATGTYQYEYKKPGTVFKTSCNHRMACVFEDKYRYNGKLCPACFWRNIYRTLTIEEEDTNKC